MPTQITYATLEDENHATMQCLRSKTSEITDVTRIFFPLCMNYIQITSLGRPLFRFIHLSLDQDVLLKILAFASIYLSLKVSGIEIQA